MRQTGELLQRKPSMLPTVTACGLALLALTLGTSALTGGFEHATFESLRGAQASDGRLQAAAVELVDSAGRKQTLWSPSGPAGVMPVRIVDFIYTRCPTVCQALGTTYEQMQRHLETHPTPGVELLTISFDIAHDDPAALTAHAQRHRADASRWTIAVPTHHAGQAELLRSLGVVAIADGLDGYVHNAALHVIDGAGRVHAIHDHAAWPQALQHAARAAAASTTAAP